MRRPQVFSVETRLWHPVEGWKTFPVGETDPGPAWHSKEGGDALGANTSAQALKDMIGLQEQIEAKDRLLAAKDHDLGKMAAARDEAVAKLGAAEQAARDAKAAQEEAEEAARQLTAERDQSRQVEATLRARIAELEAQLAAFDGDGDGKPGGSKAKKAADGEKGGL